MAPCFSAGCPIPPFSNFLHALKATSLHSSLCSILGVLTAYLAEEREAAGITVFFCHEGCTQESSPCRGPLPLAVDGGALLLPGLRPPPVAPNAADGPLSLPESLPSAGFHGDTFCQTAGGGLCTPSPPSHTAGPLATLNSPVSSGGHSPGHVTRNTWPLNGCVRRAPTRVLSQAVPNCLLR